MPNLQSECSPPEKRGAVVQWLSVFALAGLAVATWVELGTSFTNPDSVSWRFPLALPIFFCILIVAGMLIAPESPRWLVGVGRVDEARKILSDLYDSDLNAPEVNKEMDEIQEAAGAGSLGFKDAFKMGEKRNFHRLCLACAIQMFQQLTGVNCL